MELYRRYRPAKLKDLVGQEEAKKILMGFYHKRTFPHALLFSGPSGSGKTTAARIYSGWVGCHKDEFMEYNAAVARGIDTIREIDRMKDSYAMLGKSRVFYLDEAHQLSKDAQSGLLKMMEDTPDWVYFILATNEPVKLLHTIRTRCTKIVLSPLSEEELKKVLISVADKARIGVSERLLDAIIEVSEGSAREALVQLNSVKGIEKEKDRLAAIVKSGTKRTAWDLTKALLYEGKKRPDWDKVSEILKYLEREENVEGIRHLVLANARGVLYKGGEEARRAAAIMQWFIDPFYDSKHPGLVFACYNICNPR